MLTFAPYSETLLTAGEWRAVAWSNDDRYVFSEDPAKKRIVRIAVSAPHSIIPVIELPGPLAEEQGATLSSDGKTMIMSIEEVSSDIWLIKTAEPARHPF